MKLSGNVVVLVSVLASFAVTGGWSFVPLSSGKLHTTSSRQVHDGARPAIQVPVAAAAASAAGSLGPCFSSSSPFDGLAQEENNNEDHVDVVQREAEQLEEMIRGSRGIVVEAIEREWREEMLRVLGEEGERLCSEAYEGYLDNGRGAIFVSLLLLVLL